MRILKLNISFCYKNNCTKTRLQNGPQQRRKAKWKWIWFVFPFMLKTVTIFSIPLFKVQRVCGDNPTHPKTGSSIIDINFGETTRQETRSLEVCFETLGVVSEGYSIFFTSFDLRISTDRLCWDIEVKEYGVLLTQVWQKSVKIKVVKGAQQVFPRTAHAFRQLFRCSISIGIYIPGTRGPSLVWQMSQNYFRQCSDGTR